MSGNEGSTVDYTVRCPTDFASPAKPVTVILRSVVDKNKPPEWPVSCAPQIRKVVVAIRAEGGQNLPVTYLGQQVATTDASGAATVLLDMRPGDQFELKLDTSMKGYERLQPKDPVQAFHVRAKDEVLPWTPRFVVEKLKIAAKKGPVGPIKIVTVARDPL